MALLRLEPEHAGIARCDLADLRGGTPDENARQLREVLGGRLGPYRDAVLLNGGAALWVAGVSESLQQGTAKARQVLDHGTALAKLDALVAYTAAAAVELENGEQS
jgi:anthranilate phosphoribosyltransferase